MTEDKYLPKGSIIAKQYEVIETLGEDDFEILYLVRDSNRKGSFFVLKELFLETFSSRRGQNVYTLPEAVGVFKKRKSQIIEEIEAQKLNLNLNDIKIYGYEEDNETIYTVMEFSSNVGLEKYLQFVPKEAKSLPTLTELLSQRKKHPLFFLFLKSLLIIGVLLFGAFYVYHVFKTSSIEKKLEKSATMDYPKLKDRTEQETEVLESIVDVQMVAEKNISQPIIDTVILVENEVNTSVKSEVPKMLEKDENFSKLKEENLTQIMTKSIDINTSIEDINATVNIFLDGYINSISHESADKTLKYYDNSVKYYFKFKNPSHKTISKSQEHYNKKWSDREFKIVHFEILKEYKKNNTEYFDLKTTTSWTIKNKRGKKLSGKSRGKMTLKKIEDGFKITSIK